MGDLFVCMGFGLFFGSPIDFCRLLGTVLAFELTGRTFFERLEYPVEG